MGFLDEATKHIVFFWGGVNYVLYPPCLGLEKGYVHTFFLILFLIFLGDLGKKRLRPTHFLTYQVLALLVVTFRIFVHVHPLCWLPAPCIFVLSDSLFLQHIPGAQYKVPGTHEASSGTVHDRAPQTIYFSVWKEVTPCSLRTPRLKP